jgi:hypothetical protein
MLRALALVLVLPAAHAQCGPGGATQNNILEALGCADGNDGHLPGGIDTKYISAVASGV